MEFSEAEKLAKQIVLSGTRPDDSMLLIDLHKTLIGDKPAKWYCPTCTGKMDAVFIDLRLKYFNLIPKKMAKNTQYQFSKAAKANGVAEIVVMDGERTIVVNQGNLTAKNVELILADKRLAHNIEPVGTEDSEDESADAENTDFDREPTAKTASRTAATTPAKRTATPRKATSRTAAKSETTATAKTSATDAQGDANAAGADETTTAEK